MVMYFKSRCGEYTIYMGRDKYENEDLIKYGLPEDVWFHVDDLSSAHVYLRMKPGQTLDDINDDLLLDCASLVKANSIAGCKKSSVYVVYTRWKNLKKTNDMVDGAVSYHRPDNKRRINVEKNNSIVREIEKTKVERYDIDLSQVQLDREREIQQTKKQHFKQAAATELKEKKLALQEKQARSYDLIMTPGNMTSNGGGYGESRGTADETAADEYEDDFM